MFLQLTGTILEYVHNFTGTTLLIKFHEDRTIHVTFSMLTSFYYSHIQPIKEKSPPGYHVFQQTGTIFELVQRTKVDHKSSLLRMLRSDGEHLTNGQLGKQPTKLSDIDQRYVKVQWFGVGGFLGAMGVVVIWGRARGMVW
ncbi:hypothetical protein DPMN_080538 [Dreissena polymorpha]|uniref:Uncharacterized protein n=1 Tax=Dreissena polymorpha TaxID=45954 RepID=A0A9D3YR20_DREPO|nr:hypothetical protein DPMN_080538 [Dreissena polymorpha]